VALDFTVATDGQRCRKNIDREREQLRSRTYMGR